MGLILTTALVLQQFTTGFSMALAAGLQQLTFIGVYVVPGEVLAGALMALIIGSAGASLTEVILLK